MSLKGYQMPKSCPEVDNITSKDFITVITVDIVLSFVTTFSRETVKNMVFMSTREGVA